MCAQAQARPIVSAHHESEMYAWDAPACCAVRSSPRPVRSAKKASRSRADLSPLRRRLPRQSVLAMELHLRVSGHPQLAAHVASPAGKTGAAPSGGSRSTSQTGTGPVNGKYRPLAPREFRFSPFCSSDARSEPR